MNITFNHTDDEYYGIEEYIKPVVDSTIKYDIFIRILCEILNTYDSYSEHIVNDIRKVIKLFEGYQINDMNRTIKDDYAIFSENVFNFYWTIVDDEFGKKIKRYNEKLYYEKGMRYADKRLQRYRGILFEEVVCATVKDRFKDSSFCTGCRIYINRVPIFTRYGEGNAYRKVTIDIAGWNNAVNYGEFYECKINPKRFEVQNYKFFMEIKSKLEKNKVTQYVLALVSSDAKEHLKVQKEYIEKVNPECAIEFELIGREDIFNILSYRIPEIA